MSDVESEFEKLFSLDWYTSDVVIQNILTMVNDFLIINDLPVNKDLPQSLQKRYLDEAYKHRELWCNPVASNKIEKELEYIKNLY